MAADTTYVAVNLVRLTVNFQNMLVFKYDYILYNLIYFPKFCLNKYHLRFFSMLHTICAWISTQFFFLACFTQFVLEYCKYYLSFFSMLHTICAWIRTNSGFFSMLHTICAWIRTISGFLACFTIFVLTVLVFAGRLEAMWFHCVICDMWSCPILSVCVMSLVWQKTACRANIARSSRTGMKRHWICC